MITLFLIGNIASGKSTAARYLERRGALRIDLDQIAKDLYQPGSAVVDEIAQEFGWGVLDACGGIDRSALAARAFASPEDAQRLNAIVHPVVLEQLGLRLLPANCCSVMVPEHDLAVVEVSAPEGFTDAFALADEVVAIAAPVEVRRVRAIDRGMMPSDFDRRAECQPSDERLASLASRVIDNSSADDSLFDSLDRLVEGLGVSLPVSSRSARMEERHV